MVISVLVHLPPPFELTSVLPHTAYISLFSYFCCAGVKGPTYHSRDGAEYLMEIMTQDQILTNMCESTFTFLQLRPMMNVSSSFSLSSTDRTVQ